MVLLGCDIGGTFTDCVLLDSAHGRLVTHKVPTTPDNPARGAVEGLKALLAQEGVDPASVTQVVHGTTVGTNAVLTRRGPKVALVTNAGFEDILEIARQDRPSLYDLLADRPIPLVSRESRYGVPGRLDPEGREVVALDEATLANLAPELAATHGAVAIVFLHAYVDSAHETRAAMILKGLAPDLPVTTSSETAPEFREYERASTTVINAFLLPVMDRYLDDLLEGLRSAGVRAPLLVLDSAGGVVTPAAVRRRPVTTVVSGPAGGAAACAALARMVDEPRLLGLDMGGTSTDLCRVVDGMAQEAMEGAIEGYPVRIPMLDIVTLGAGGGSIARVDAGGLLRVGPESAGAQPGPACYRRGGTLPTVTDAHAVLGHVDSLLAGAFALDVDAARQAFAPLAEALGCTVEEAAAAVQRVADAHVSTAARLALTERGDDPRDYALCAFGGAGPLHAVDVARALGIARVIVPPTSGVLSAFGMLAAPLRRDGVRTWLSEELAHAPAALESLGKATLAEAVADGVPAEGTVVRYAFDARYRGQSFELTIPLNAAEDLRDAAAAFHRAHREAFGYDDPEGEVEVVNLRATVLHDLQKGLVLATLPEATEARPPPEALRTRRRAVMAGRDEHVDVWKRDGLRAGHRVSGPAIVEDAGSTTLLPRGASARVDAHGNLVVEVSE